jgi:hypothetical protein
MNAPTNKEVIMSNFREMADRSIVLVFSYSFPDGALLTQEAFVLFLKIASRTELEDFSYALITPLEAANTEYDHFTTLDVREALLGSYELQ